MREPITLMFLLLMLVVGFYGFALTALNSPRITDQIDASSDPFLRAISFLERTYLFLYLPAVIEIVFIICGCFGPIKYWSKIVASYWQVLTFYGLLFLAFAATGLLTTTTAYNAAVSPIGYGRGIANGQLRSIIQKIYSTTGTGLKLWLLAAGLFISLPPLKARASSRGK